MKLSSILYVFIARNARDQASCAATQTDLQPVSNSSDSRHFIWSLTVLLHVHSVWRLQTERWHCGCCEYMMIW